MKINFGNVENAKIIVLFAGKKNDELNLSPAAQKFDRKIKGRLSKAIASQSYDGSASSILQISAPDNDYELAVLVGIGDLAKTTNESFEKAMASVIKATIAIGPKNMLVCLKNWGRFSSRKIAASCAMGALLASYRFDKYKTKSSEKSKPKLEEITFDIEGSEDEFAISKAIYDGVAFARDLANEPANILNTDEFANRLNELQSLGIEVKIIGEKEMQSLGMHSFYGVGQGSNFESRLVIMQYKGGGDEAPLALVGKGLCFDSGGISIKPSGGMEDMKGDMGGAAAVSGTMKAIALRKAKANVIGFVGLAENMPDGNAQRPGDIVKSMSGQTIEILNTDAEGRLVLCDVLTYAQKFYSPKYMIDLATLTGAIIIALGNEYAGLFSNSDDLVAKLNKAAGVSGEKVWRFPMGNVYNKMLDSNIADMKNVVRSGGGAGAGSITAAQFLGRFIDDGVNWAHIDIAGTAMKSSSDDPREPTWGTGYGVRLLDELIRQNFER